jgi:hypothetical protein
MEIIKGDKIYNNRFDVKTENLEYVYIIKNGEVKCYYVYYLIMKILDGYYVWIIKLLT